MSFTTFKLPPPRKAWLPALASLLLISLSSALAAEVAGTTSQAGDAVVAPVIVDGQLVLQVRGTSAYPARERAQRTRERIIDAARDASFVTADLVVLHEADNSAVYAGDRLLTRVFDVDAEIEGLERKLLTEVVRQKIASVIDRYRKDRSPGVLSQHAAYAVGLTVVLTLLFMGIFWVFRRLHAWSERHVQESVETLASKSHHLIRANQLWALVTGLLGAARVFALVVLGYFYLNTVLGLFPWTRPFALILLDLVLNPLMSLWRGFVESLPDLAFLVVLALVVRYLLKLVGMFFSQVARGRIKLQNFDSDWALPTHKIIRLLVIAFALIIAYPYIPGSDSMAFKGVSVFLGLIFSLGSTSFIANIMAGLTMTYRGAFKEGDRVQIDDVVGTVVEVKLMTTRVLTPKKESVLIPNSNILNSNVTNYSVTARGAGVLLHSTVSIGYDVPWRQVEAMLLLAAERTGGLKNEPTPFVLQNSMGDFAVNYEINAYCTEVEKLQAIRSDLHRNIQDVFSEYGVQIMSPAYETDPETPKVVAPEDWYAEPAARPDDS